VDANKSGLEKNYIYNFNYNSSLNIFGIYSLENFYDIERKCISLKQIILLYN